MAVTFTTEQQRAIDLHGCNILVSAAAGSGKTAVLVERIVKMVCDERNPVDIDRLLIVTFTNAAAAEMRERIAAGISKRLTERPESEHIQKQATLLHNAQITTIDSFCLFLLRNHFNEIGLDPAFRIADEGEIRLMQQEVLAELIEDSYASGNEAFRFCVEYFCPGGKESVLEQHILNLSRYAASFPWPERWLEERKNDYSASSVEEMCGSPYALYLTGHLRRMISGCAEKIARVRSLCEEPDGPYMYGELVEGELEQLEGLLVCASLEEYAVKLPAVKFGRLPSKKDDSVSVLKRELAKEIRAGVKDSIREMDERFFATTLELAARQSSACREPVGTLIGLVLDFDRRMQEKKQEKKVIDFSDMEHYALDILLDAEGEEIRPSAVAREYRQHFAEILTDEYQDSNLVQEYLLKAVSGEEDGQFNRFMVGDVKQSIYKFRLARPELFLEKYETYETDEPEPGGRGSDSCVGESTVSYENNPVPPEEEKMIRQPAGTDSRRMPACLRIDLARNFRSRVQVVDAVNDVFCRMMSAEVGGIAYDSRAALYPGAVYPENDGCASELILVDKPGKGDELSAKQEEALAIAHKIKALRESFLVTDRGSGQERPAKYGDMVILLRTNSGWDEEFKEVLEQEGIPVYITSKTGYFAAVEVQELLQVLRVLDNPCQDIPLFGVMKSVFGGFTEEEAARIRSHAKGCSLYEALKKFAEDYGDYDGGDQGICGKSDCGSDGGDRNIPGAAEDERENGDEAGLYGDKDVKKADADISEPHIPETGAFLEDGNVIKEKKTEEQERENPGHVQREQEIPDGEMISLGEKAAAFLRMIASYRAYTVYLPIRDLLTKLINDFGYLEYVTAQPTGSRKRANVEMLLTKASDFEKTSYFGLFHFIRYMGQLEKYDVDYGGAEQLDENADVVRIMSIHKSKGLEFPVTFVAGMSKRFNMQDVNQSLILDMDLGLGTDYVDPDRRIRNKTLRRTSLSRKLREESLAEELRLLYVAMTRAREKLIMTGAVENAREKWERQMELGSGQLSYLDFVEAGSFLDFLFPVLPGTCVKVSVAEQEELEAGELMEQIQLSGRREALSFAGQQADSEAEKRLRECLNAVYPYAMLSELYTKTTVSELKIAAMADRDEAAYHTFEEKEIQPYIPMFRREEEKVSGPVRGNAYHRVMELLDFEAVIKLAEKVCGSAEAVPDDGDVMGEKQEYSARSEDGQMKVCQAFSAEGKGWSSGSQEVLSTLDEKKLAFGVRAFLEKEAEEKRLTKEYFQAVNIRKIVHFLRTSLAARMYRAQKNGKLYREQPFVLGIDARRLKSDFPPAETVLIQGIIDVFFEEEDGLVLLDYKTDSVASMKELWNRYETQLDYYQEAIQKIYGKPVKERILYSFHLERYDAPADI